jgi:hypothetical protein
MVRFYLVPKVGAGTITDPFRPKYFTENGISFSGLDLGIEPTILVGADTTDAQHAILAAQSDVYAIPALTSTVGGNPTLNQTRNRLEQRGIPGSWVIASTTYRAIVTRIGDTCRIAQRLNGRHKNRLYPTGVTLDSTLTQDLLTQLTDIAGSFGISAAGLSTSTTLRQALITLGDQLPPFVLAGETF